MSQTPFNVLIVDDDAHRRAALGQTLELADYAPILVRGDIEAKDHIHPSFVGVILAEFRVPGKGGGQLLDYAQKIDADLPVILLADKDAIPVDMRGNSAGAFDLLEKPYAPQDLLQVIEKARKTRTLVLENRRLRAQLETGDAAERLLFGQSHKARELRTRARAAALSGTEVMITGEPGTGTSKVAEVIHLMSPRATGRFVKARAAGITAGITERITADGLAELIRSADHGSLFLDEVGALGTEAQHALLQHLERAEGARILAGTYRDLSLEAATGRFNPDLYYKLDVMRIRIPSLRERPDDIPVLFRHYVDIACEQAALPVPEVTPEVITRLMAQDWPGNARALMSAATRFAMGLSEVAAAAEPGLAEQLAGVERSLLVEALRKEQGASSAAAKRLKLPRKTFYDKLARHGLRAEDFRQDRR